jgi:hypothetical protein
MFFIKGLISFNKFTFSKGDGVIVVHTFNGTEGSQEIVFNNNRARKYNINLYSNSLLNAKTTGYNAMFGFNFNLNVSGFRLISSSVTSVSSNSPGGDSEESPGNPTDMRARCSLNINP